MLMSSSPKIQPITKQNHSLISFSAKGSLAFVSSIQLSKRWEFVARASSATDSESSKSEGEGGGGGGGGGRELKFEEYEVEIEKPYGLKFAKGRDGSTYIDAIFPGGAADKAGVFSVGDKSNCCQA
ncbi:uncharacterized protein A4U43_C10F13250 [Asparagus officinalis]|uniref:PDZ domain-containing protein n=1 Tax=Asparagus officinalis TaxID=4686 RepID=A0A5P1E2F3_ASPOF|nr:uncharacterized protein A4U43_C10F13250 [Asparagus officinalis]